MEDLDLNDLDLTVLCKDSLNINNLILNSLREMAQRTGLEPATPGVTGRYSNQLNYRCEVLLYCRGYRYMVGADGIEPPTFCL